MSMSNQSATKKCIFYTSQLGTTNEQFVWTIEKFSELKGMKSGECLQSTEFITTTPKSQLLKWRMQIYPSGFDKNSKDYISLYLTPIHSASTNEEVEAKYQFSIRKPSGDEFKFNAIGLKYHGSMIEAWSWDRKPMIKMRDLLNEKNGYLDGNGRLTVVCTLMVQQKVDLSNIEVPECQVIQEDLSHLFEKSLFTDSKIISADGKEYKVHKCILGCRSPVFEALFQQKMAENNDNIIDIEDIKGDVIYQMLLFIYSGKEPDWGGEMAQDLLMAAEKYGLIRLKLRCERKLINSLGNANACELLQLANLHSAEQLKTNALDFIKIHLNEVMESEGWKKLADKQLMEQVLKAMAKCE